MKEETRLKRKQEIYVKMQKWLEEHEGAFPRYRIVRDGKELTVKEMTEEEKYEVRLASNFATYFSSKPQGKNEKLNIKILNKVGKITKWLKENKGKLPKSIRTSKKDEKSKRERNIYSIFRSEEIQSLINTYQGTPLEKIPTEYREFFELYRAIPQSDKVFEMIIYWLKKNNGQFPRTAIYKNKRKLSRPEMSEDEAEEVRLYDKWKLSKAKKILNQYVGVPLEKIPAMYREYISKMREFGYGLKDEPCFEEIVKWLEENQDQLPRREIDGKKEEYETSLRKRWDKSEEKEILEKYKGRPIDDVPEEFREKIAILRSHELGLTDKELEENLFKWIIENDGRLPRTEIRRKGAKTLKKGFTKEETREVKLNYRWKKSKLKEVLEEYAGKNIEEVPEEYREKIKILREYGHGREKIEVEDVFGELIKWLKEHNGAFPRTAIRFLKAEDPERRVKNSYDMTTEERYEISLSHRWFRTEEHKIFLEYKDKEIEEVPEEYRDKIEKIRKHHVPVTEKYKEDAEKTFEEYILWLDSHQNKVPRCSVYYHSKRLSAKKISEEDLYEIRLYTRFKKSKIRKILDEYAGRPLEEVPEEYRDKIRILREHGVMGKNKSQKAKERIKKAVVKNVEENESTRHELESQIRKREEKI